MSVKNFLCECQFSKFRWFMVKKYHGCRLFVGSQMVQKEIGAFYYIIRPDGHCVLQFMPLNENCRVRGASGSNLEEGTEIYDADVKIAD